MTDVLMATAPEIAAALEAPGANARQLVIKKEYLTPFQKEILEYQACYDGRLFDDKKRKYPWGQQYDPDRDLDIERDQWIPRFIPGLAKELVQTLSSYLTGRDKFPSIRAASKEPLFQGLEIEKPEEQEGTEPPEPEELQRRAQEKALNQFVSELLGSDQADFNSQVSAALDKALVKGESVVLTRFYGGRVWLTLPDREWCNWTFDQKDPTKIVRFTETWFFTRPGKKDPAGNDQVYLFRRTIDQATWLEEEIPLIKRQGEDKESLGPSVITFSAPHGFDFCPVTIFESVDCRSIYADEMLCNIRGYIESYNDVHCGTFDNMRPQWVALRKAAEASYAAQKAARPGGEDDDEQPLVKGRLWNLSADSIQSFANQTAGYEMGNLILAAEKGEIRGQAKIIDIPPDTDLSGRALVMLFGPQYAAIDRWRNRCEKAFRDLILKIIKAALSRLSELVIGPDIPTPTAAKNLQLKISLDWGQLIPVTPEIVSAELDNVTRAVDACLLSQKTAQEYTLPLFHVEDIECEREQIEREKAERAAAEMEIAAANFESMKEGQDAESDTAGET